MNTLFFPLLLSLSLSLLYPHAEVQILYAFCAIAVLAHLHYGTSVVGLIFSVIALSGVK